MQFSSCQGHVDACLDMQPCTKMKKNTIRAGDGTALYAAYMVNTFDMINTVDLVYTVNTVDNVYSIYTIQTTLDCFNSS